MPYKSLLLCNPFNVNVLHEKFTRINSNTIKCFIRDSASPLNRKFIFFPIASKFCRAKSSKQECVEGKDYLDKLERSDDLKQIKIHLHST